MAIRKKNIIRIGIDGGDFNPASGPESGIGRLLQGFLSGYQGKLSDKNKLFVYGFSGKKNGFGELVHHRLLPRRYFSTFFLPAALIADRIDVYLGFSGVLPPFVRLLKKKSIVFIHDFAFLDYPENYGEPEKMRWQTEYAVYGADRIVVFSDYIREQLFKRYPKISKEKVFRVYPGMDHLRPHHKAVSEKDKPYFLYVGVIKPAKNIMSLLSRFEKFIRLSKNSNARLILVGPKEEKYFESIQKTLVYQKVKGRVEFKSNIKDEKLIDLYQKSIALLNVSHEEGFCYPVAEALALGTPAIVNEIPLYKEFATHYEGVKITQNEEEFLDAMEAAVEGLIPASPKSKKPFAWNSFTQQITEIIDGLYR